jgi:multiple sugar transport system ATP-binding protein
VGDPLELYNPPANKFVAGFIGSPAMNFATVTSQARQRRITGEEAAASRIEVPNS